MRSKRTEQPRKADSVRPRTAPRPASLRARNERRGAKSLPQAFAVGDHVSWSSEAGRVSGRIARVHTRDVRFKGYVHHASVDDPQYEIRSDKTDHIALHKARALRRLQR